ncbi:ATP-grasp domain-containing protein [Plantactinospora sp. WMMC1484]|uniref:ATP-grasp domain-containing protein n=1 Tax=Plantactinospora sp. WMMC1484 TaxID=3404122 RepID=UPI003BF518A5
MHVLVVGAWPELASQLVGLPARMSLFQLPELANDREADWVYRYQQVDYRDPGAALAAASLLHAADPFDAVAGFREFALAAVATIAGGLGLPCLPGPAHTLGQDKAVVRKQLHHGGCRTVAHRLCDGPADIVDLAEQVGFPVIVKPVAGSASEGVHAVGSPGAAEAAWAHAAAVDGGARILAEQFLDGPEYSVETRTVDGWHEVVAITEKLTTGDPHRVETGHVMPARVGRRTAAALADEAVRGLSAIGHRLGPSHVELIVTSSGPAIVEINRRIGGDRIWELLMLATGRNLMRESLLDLVGTARTPPAPVRSRGAAIRFLTAARPARLADPLPVGAARGVGGVVRERLTTPGPGAIVRPPRSSDDRLGYVVTVAATPEQAASAADAAHRRVAARLFADASIPVGDGPRDGDGTPGEDGTPGGEGAE